MFRSRVFNTAKSKSYRVVDGYCSGELVDAAICPCTSSVDRAERRGLATAAYSLSCNATLSSELDS